MFSGSSVKSVSENAFLQSYVFLWPANIPCIQNQSITPCDTLIRCRLKPKSAH